MNPYVIVSPGTCGVDPSSASQSCLPGQVKIANNKCVQAVDNCKTYNQSSGDCMTCQKGYFINLKTKTCS
jgi:hypothetical protein